MRSRALETWLVGRALCVSLALTSSIGAQGNYIESFQEVHVDLANNSAEFPSIGQVTVISKSGTNQLHGAVFDYVRRDRIAALITKAVHPARWTASRSRAPKARPTRTVAAWPSASGIMNEIEECTGSTVKVSAARAAELQTTTTAAKLMRRNAEFMVAPASEVENL